MVVAPLDKEIVKYLKRYRLERKYQKQSNLLVENFRHPSLNVEKLEPKDDGVYSFRLDRTYRVLFLLMPDRETIEIMSITKHYK